MKKTRRETEFSLVLPLRRKQCRETLASNSFSQFSALYLYKTNETVRSARLVQNNRSITVLTFLETCDLFLYSKYNRAIRRPVQSRHDAFKNFTHSTFHKMRVSGTPELGYKILAFFSNLVEIQPTTVRINLQTRITGSIGDFEVFQLAVTFQKRRNSKSSYYLLNSNEYPLFSTRKVLSTSLHF